MNGFPTKLGLIRAYLLWRRGDKGFRGGGEG